MLSINTDIEIRVARLCSLDLTVISVLLTCDIFLPRSFLSCHCRREISCSERISIFRSIKLEIYFMYLHIIKTNFLFNRFLLNIALLLFTLVSGDYLGKLRIRSQILMPKWNERKRLSSKEWIVLVRFAMKRFFTIFCITLNSNAKRIFSYAEDALLLWISRHRDDLKMTNSMHLVVKDITYNNWS